MPSLVFAHGARVGHDGATVDNLAEYILFGLYVAAGPLMSVLFGIALVKGRKRMMLVQRPAMALPTRAPPVTILVPARNEGERIEECLRSVLGQDWPELEVVAIDDRSSDGTGRVMDELSQGDRRLKVVHIAAGPPEGWTGKCHALDVGVGQATGEWLLFVDSDVVLERDALPATMAFALDQGVDLVSLLPKLECRSFWERLLIPIAGCALNMMHLTALTNNNHRRAAFANGQYMLFRRQVYEAVGGHRAVRDRFCEDIAFAQLLKGGGYQVRISWGTHLATVRMYDSLAAIRRGWARIFFAAGMGTPGRIISGSAYVVACWYSVWAAIGWSVWRMIHPVNAFGAWGWLGVAGTHLVMLTGLLGAMYAWSGNRRRSALLWPVGIAMLLGIFGKSLRMCLTGMVEWRGMRYRLRQSGKKRDWIVVE